VTASRLERVLTRGRTPRVIGFDDAPFRHRRNTRVNISGIVCSGTRFEGMLWGHVRKDGWTATRTVQRMLENSKFASQVHVVLLDGIAFGGFNIVDLPTLAEQLDKPCVALMRRPPDLVAIERALQHLSQPQRRMRLIRRAGPIHHHPPFTFQVQGADPKLIADVLPLLTDRGHVPEALRLAHLIGAAVKTGESGKRA